jgi:hypothetical protein
VHSSGFNFLFFKVLESTMNNSKIISSTHPQVTTAVYICRRSGGQRYEFQAKRQVSAESEDVKQKFTELAAGQANEKRVARLKPKLQRRV